MIFHELYKHGRLAAKRHPMYEKNKMARLLGYAMGGLWAGYLMFFGTTFAFGFADMFPHREPYHVMNGAVLAVILVIDFLLRMPLQKPPTQEVKPYLLLPVRRSRIVDFLLLRSGLSSFNLFWMFLFVPFAVITVSRYYGTGGVVSYLAGILLLIVANNYWYLLCRSLINDSWKWIGVPLAVYACVACLLFLPDESPLFYGMIDLGDGYIEGDLRCFIGTVLAIGLLWWTNRRVLSVLIYKELAGTDEENVRQVSDYRFFERYGEVGEYMRLELKLLMRNRRCKGALRNIGCMIAVFSAALSFSDVYNGRFMTSFICVYNFAAFGMVILSQLMSFEGNYIDGLMSRKESIKSLLRAKYYLYSLGEIVPFLLMIPAMVTHKLSLQGAFAWFFYTIGFIYFGFFQLAVYNKHTLPLNEKVTSRQVNSAIQMAINFGAFGVPLLLFGLLRAAMGETAAYVVLLTIGIGFVLASPWWLDNIYHRFMQRRYDNMEGFRNSRQ